MQKKEQTDAIKTACLVNEKRSIEKKIIGVIDNLEIFRLVGDLK